MNRACNGTAALCRLVPKAVVGCSIGLGQSDDGPACYIAAFGAAVRVIIPIRPLRLARVPRGARVGLELAPKRVRLSQEEIVDWVWAEVVFNLHGPWGGREGVVEGGRATGDHAPFVGTIAPQ